MKIFANAVARSGLRKEDEFFLCYDLDQVTLDFLLKSGDLLREHEAGHSSLFVPMEAGKNMADDDHNVLNRLCDGNFQALEKVPVYQGLITIHGGRDVKPWIHLRTYPQFQDITIESEFKMPFLKIKAEFENGTKLFLSELRIG